MSKSQRRPQAQKSRRSQEHQQRVMDIRSSSAASPHKSGKEYKRKPKHGGWA